MVVVIQVVVVVAVVVVGCEYGDRASWCPTFSALDCSIPDQRMSCCSTCGTYTSSTTTTTTTITTTPSTTTTTTTTTTSTTTTAAVTTAFSMVDGRCPDGDLESFCVTMSSSDCYHQSDVCCATCLDYSTDVKGWLRFAFVC